MDSGDLSEEAYRGILVEAEKFNHDLTLQFGLLSVECEDEDEFVKESAVLIKEMENYSHVDLDDMFFGNIPKQKDFKMALKRILKNIDEIRSIPFEKRTFL